jgi:AcrR family transcriptional regulator
MKSRAKRRTGEERRKFRDELIKIAALTFLELGIRDAKMDDVAERTGKSKVILYRHFASKDDLIHTILEREADRLLEIDRRPYKGGIERAKELMDAAREDKSSFILLIRDARNDPVYGEHHERVRDAIFKRLVTAFEKRAMTSSFSRISADAIANLALDSTLYWLENGDPSKDDLFIEWYGRGAHSLDKGWRSLEGLMETPNPK